MGYENNIPSEVELLYMTLKGVDQLETNKISRFYNSLSFSLKRSIDRGKLKELIRENFIYLSPREQEVITLRYLGDHLTLEQISERMENMETNESGVTRERVRRVWHHALGIFRRSYVKRRFEQFYNRYQFDLYSTD